MREPASTLGHIPRRTLRVGEDALRFTRWYVGGKYALMGGFLGDLEDPPEAREAAVLRDRFLRAVARGRRVALARALVTALLALGIVTAAVATVANLVLLPDAMEGNVRALNALLSRVAAGSATSAVALVALRMALDRYLELVDTSATFLAMQLASARAPPAPTAPPR